MPKDDTKIAKKGSFAGELGDIVKSYIFPIIAVLGLGLMTYFVYVPYVRQIPGMVSEQKTLDQNIIILDANLAKLGEFNKMPLDTMTSALDELIPTEARVAELVSTLSNLANQAGIVVIIPNEEEDEEQEENTGEGIVEDIIAGESDSGTEYQIKRIPVRLSFSGTRNQVQQYMQLIREDTRVLSVETASISVMGDLWEVELVVNGYRGEVLTTSVPDSSQINAQSDKVLTPVSPISIELTEASFNEVTSSY